MKKLAQSSHLEWVVVVFFIFFLFFGLEEGCRKVLRKLLEKRTKWSEFVAAKWWHGKGVWLGTGGGGRLRRSRRQRMCVCVCVLVVGVAQCVLSVWQYVFMFADLLLVWFRFSHKLQLQLQLALLLNIKLSSMTPAPLPRSFCLPKMLSLFLRGLSEFPKFCPTQKPNFTAKWFALKAQQLCRPRQQSKKWVGNSKKAMKKCRAKGNLNQD